MGRPLAYPGNKRLTADFVPFDPRRTWSAADLHDRQHTFAIDRQATCTLRRRTDRGSDDCRHPTSDGHVAERDMLQPVRSTPLNTGANDIGFVAGRPGIFADVQHSGWRDAEFGAASGRHLHLRFFGSTVGGVFVPSDIDGNGLADAAFREIYYDPSIQWLRPDLADDGVANIDVESGLSTKSATGSVQDTSGRYG